MIYFIYFIISFLVVWFSLKCAKYVDLIDKKTDLSGAFIGGIILAAVTSLPELITSFSSIVIVDNAELVLGNILGSNIFNLSVLALGVVFSYKKFISSKISLSHMKTIPITIIIYILIITSLFIVSTSIFSINIVSIIILILYILSVKFLSNNDIDSSKDENIIEDTCKLTIKQIITRFIIMAISLIFASVLITYTTDIIATKLNMGSTLAGALFLGIATSLPELSSSIALIKMGNFNATVGNIIGSNMFNFLILFISDILYSKGSIYIKTKEVSSLVIFGLISSIFIGITLFLKSKKIESKFLYTVIASISVLCYFAFLIFSI
ncbi:MAG: cation transporter [Oscillospiraceae bacterium]|nr:cation transporter [Oscillospiraceae bacterium]